MQKRSKVSWIACLSFSLLLLMPFFLLCASADDKEEKLGQIQKQLENIQEQLEKVQKQPEQLYKVQSKPELIHLLLDLAQVQLELAQKKPERLELIKKHLELIQAQLELVQKKPEKLEPVEEQLKNTREKFEQVTKKPEKELKPGFALFLANLSLTGSYSHANNASATGIYGTQLPLLTINETDIRSYGIGYYNKPIVSQFLAAIKMDTDKKNHKALWDIFIDPIKFNAGISRSDTLESKQGVLTDNLTSRFNSNIGISYSIDIDTILYHLPGARSSLFKQ